MQRVESDMILSSPSAPEGGSPNRYRLALQAAAADAQWPELRRGALGIDRKGVALVVSGCLPPTILEAGRWQEGHLFPLPTNRGARIPFLEKVWLAGETRGPSI